jgi:hypothetical protein
VRRRRVLLRRLEICCSEADLLPQSQMIRRLPQAELLAKQHERLLDRRPQTAQLAVASRRAKNAKKRAVVAVARKLMGCHYEVCGLTWKSTSHCAIAPRTSESGRLWRRINREAKGRGGSLPERRSPPCDRGDFWCSIASELMEDERSATTRPSPILKSFSSPLRRPGAFGSRSRCRLATSPTGR